jgi:hypothetical protein
VSEPRTWLKLTFPREVSTTQTMAALLAISGMSSPRARGDLILQALGTSVGVTHQVGVDERLVGALTRQLRTAVPGISIEEGAEGLPAVSRAWRGWQSTPSRSLRSDDPEIISSGLLTALAAVQGDELLLLRWVLGPVRRPMAVGGQVTGAHSGGIIRAVGKAAIMAPMNLDNEARGALRLKTSLPGWRAVLHIGVRAEGVDRQRQLLGQLASAVRVAQGPGVELGFDPVRPEVVSQLRRLCAGGWLSTWGSWSDCLPGPSVRPSICRLLVFVVVYFHHLGHS